MNVLKLKKEINKSRKREYNPDTREYEELPELENSLTVSQDINEKQQTKLSKMIKKINRSRDKNSLNDPRPLDLIQYDIEETKKRRKRRKNKT